MGKRGGITIKLDGFEEILGAIKNAGGSVDKAAENATRQSAQIVQSELKAQMQQSNVDSGLINAMPPPEIFKDGNAVVAKVGYKKGNYDPANISDGYKVVFLNYGTPNRKKHGRIVQRGFIQRTKKSAAPKVKKVQKQVFDKILARLKNK